MIARGRADALMEMLDFLVAFTGDHTDVNCKILDEKIDVGWDCIGLQKGNDALRDGLDIALFKLHSSGKVDEEWMKVTGAEMLVKIPARP